MILSVKYDKNMKHKGECTMNVNTSVNQTYEKLITEINEVTAENKSFLTAAFIVCDILFAVMIFTTMVR